MLIRLIINSRYDVLNITAVERTVFAASDSNNTGLVWVINQSGAHS